ncbi:hypothetical protein FQN54_001582 [Arachnomyces sp. PD_36]|nr:hypothetical protein FQN54_001582 [Arachnomyces sp. PD_36]
MGDLFVDKKFWFSRNVPQSQRLKELVQSHGGNVVLLENQADIRLTDHAKRDPPPNSYSYQYVEKSVQNGKLENLEDHRVGPSRGVVRPVGGRTSRRPFTAEDDKILRNWMEPHEHAQGSVSGNKIYQDLEAKHPQHTFQSWRNRYLKVVRNAQPSVSPLSTEVAAHTTRHHERSADDGATTPKQRLRRQGSPQFTAEEKDSLLQAASLIMSQSPRSRQKGWFDYAATTDKTSEEWQEYFDREILPVYLAQQSKGISVEQNCVPPHSKPAIHSSSSLRTRRADSRALRNEDQEDLSQTGAQRQQHDVSFRPQSPSIQPTRASMTGDLQRPGRKSRELDESPADGVALKSPSPKKRKRDRNSIAHSAPTPPETKRRPSPKPQRPAIAVAVEIPVMRRHTSASASPSHHPSTQLLSYPDSTQHTAGNARRTTPLGEPSRPTTSQSSQIRPGHQSEDAPQFPEDARDHETPVDMHPRILVSPNQADNDIDDLKQKLAFLPPPQRTVTYPDHGTTSLSSNNNADPPFQLEEWMASRLKSGKAGSEAQLIRALRCCSMEPNLADKVLGSLRSGKPIPGNIAGVWTAEDDEILQTGQARDIDRLLKKHGDDFCQKRHDYFKLLSEVEKG